MFHRLWEATPQSNTMDQDDATLKIRNATPADAETIVRFNQQMAMETESKTLDPSRLRRGVDSALKRPDLCRYFLAEQHGRVIGQVMVTYEWSDWRDGVFWWLQSVYVDADCRRRGVFRALYRHLERLARRAPDVCGLRLYVENSNHQAATTYRRLGMSDSRYLVYEADWSESG